MLSLSIFHIYATQKFHNHNVSDSINNSTRGNLLQPLYSTLVCTDIVDALIREFVCLNHCTVIEAKQSDNNIDNQREFDFSFFLSLSHILYFYIYFYF